MIIPQTPDDLIAAVAKRLATQGHGSQVRLATDPRIKVDPQTVSNWLARRRDPDCARTLALIEWLASDDLPTPDRGSESKTEPHPRSRFKKKIEAFSNES